LVFVAKGIITATAMLRVFLPVLGVCAPIVASFAQEVRVNDPVTFRDAVAAAKPGTRILLAPGEYGGGHSFQNVRGTREQPVLIAAADPARPPVFRGRGAGLHLSNPAHLELRDLAFVGQSGNGVNIDEGGKRGEAVGIVLRGLRVQDVGSRGNQDCIKLSGIGDFTVVGCTIEGWGAGGGSGIDMVGCHRGIIEKNTFRHSNAHGSSGVQCKGGSGSIVIRENVFDDAGGRAINIGGSTGLQYFRPPLKTGQEHAEARDIRVERNRFKGSLAPITFAGADGGIVRFNTFESPGKWIIRILQETREPGFVPCRNGQFTDNVIVFQSNRWSEGGVNASDGTAPETFQFARNWWYCSDAPERSRPRLPVAEKDGVYGRDPATARPGELPTAKAVR
jgi:hypothetical protein